MMNDIQPPKLVTPTINEYVSKKLMRPFYGVAGERAQLVTLQFPTSNYQTPYYFAPQTLLDGDNCTITAIDVVRSNEPTVLSFLPNGSQNFVDTYFAQGVLYMSNLNREIIAELPLNQLDSTQNSGKKCFTWIDTHVWQNCYVMFTSNTFTIPTIQLAFMVYYLPKEKN